MHKEKKVAIVSSVLTAKDVAHVLHVGRDKAYLLMKYPTFPSIQLGGRYLVTEQALFEWLQNNECNQLSL